MLIYYEGVQEIYGEKINNNVITQYYIVNLTKQPIVNFPIGVTRYAYSFILPEKLFHMLTDYLAHSGFLIDVDYESYTAMGQRMHIISVNESVYNNSDIRSHIVEYLL